MLTDHLFPVIVVQDFFSFPVCCLFSAQSYMFGRTGVLGEKNIDIFKKNCLCFGLQVFCKSMVIIYAIENLERIMLSDIYQDHSRNSRYGLTSSVQQSGCVKGD